VRGYHGFELAETCRDIRYNKARWSTVANEGCLYLLIQPPIPRVKKYADEKASTYKDLAPIVCYYADWIVQDAITGMSCVLNKPEALHSVHCF
jgi:hypothetical protein